MYHIFFTHSPGPWPGFKSAGFKSCERDSICGRRNQTGWTVMRGQTQGGTRCWSCLVGEVERVPRQAGRLRGEKGGTSLDWLARETVWIIEQPFKQTVRKTDI